eukprot:g13957.t1
MGRGFQKNRSSRGGGGTGRSFSRGGNRGQQQQQRRGGTKSPRRVAFKPRPAPPMPEALSSLPKFIKKTKFAGRRTGYFFSRGKGGLGYYVDRVQIGAMGEKLRSKLAATLKPTDAAAAAARAAGDAATPGGSKTSSSPSPSSSPAASVSGKFAENATKEGKSLPAAAGDDVAKKTKKKSAVVAVPKLTPSPPSNGSTGAGKPSQATASPDASEEDEEEEGEEEEEEEEEESSDDDGEGDGESDGSEEAAEAEDDGSGGGSSSSSSSSSSDEDEEDEDGEDGQEHGEAAAKNSAAAAAAVARAAAVATSTKKAALTSDGSTRGANHYADEAGDGDEDAESGSGGSSSSSSDDDDEEEQVVETGKGREGKAEAEKEEEEQEEEEEGEGEGEGEQAPPQPEEDVKASFESLGVTGPLCEAAAQLGWTHATEIQRQALPLAFKGKDVIGLAETGSGKTGAFAIPILQALLENPQRLFAVVMAPTRELAFQINEVMEALGVGIGLKTVCIVGGIDMFQQSVALALKPHVVIATPGRLVDHLENTKGFSLRTAKYLVLDEADRMLGMDFEEEINKVLSVLPRERRTFLFSATMTSKVAKLQRASLKSPSRVEVAHKFATPKTLVQQYLFIPAKHKDCYLAYVLNEFAGQSTIVFVSTCNNAQRVALLLRNLGFQAVCLHGQMGQPKRLGALGKFKSGQRNVLIATDVASRGLDIPSVDLVVNMEIPSHGKDYIHRVGRTARAGRAGRSIAFVTQYDVEVYQRMEALIGQKLPPYTCDEETVLVLQERVGEAQRMAAREMREADFNRKGKRRGGEGAEDAETVVRSFKRQRMGGGGGGGRGGGRGGRGRGARR